MSGLKEFRIQPAGLGSIGGARGFFLSALPITVSGDPSTNTASRASCVSSSRGAKGFGMHTAKDTFSGFECRAGPIRFI